MKFYFYPEDGSKRHLMKKSELEQHMGKLQIKDAIEDKLAAPSEDVSYLSVGGTITLEI